MKAGVFGVTSRRRVPSSDPLSIWSSTPLTRTSPIDAMVKQSAVSLTAL